MRIPVLVGFGRILRCSMVVGVAIMAMGQVSHAGTQADAAVTSEAVEASASASVTGFRSAVFGMDEKAVYAAIIRDFGLDETKVMQNENTIERTKLLTILVPNLLEGGGVAQVSYIFGYKSKKLIQVGVSWNVETDPEMVDTKLVANGDILSSHFLSDGFPSSSITTATAVANGILLFRGIDAEGRAAILLLQGDFKEGTNGQNALKPTGLALLYSVDPDAPDIFRIKEGDF